MDRPLEILLVEDSESDCELFQLAVREMQVDARVDILHHGQEAHRFLAFKAEAQDIPPPDIIVLDLMLPGMPGSELLRFIKTHGYVKDMPAVLLSSVEPPTSLKEQLRDADLFRIKPANWNGLLDLVGDVIALAHQSRGRAA